MQIDLFTLVLQVVNFLVLIYLLKRFLYGPIVNAMEERERRIAERFSDADQARQDSEQEADRFRQERQEFEQQREKMAAKAKQEIEARRETVLEEAHADVDRAKNDWLEALDRDKEKFQRQIELKIGEYTRKVAARTLQDLANQQLESQMVDVFIERLTGMQEVEQRQIADAVREEDNRVVVKSAFALTEFARSRLSSALQDQLGISASTDLQFECSPEVISGIELISGGYHIYWTARDYLNGLQEQVLQMINERTAHRDTERQE